VAYRGLHVKVTVVTVTVTGVLLRVSNFNVQLEVAGNSKYWTFKPQASSGLIAMIQVSESESESGLGVSGRH
jgi:hypothetical protein